MDTKLTQTLKVLSLFMFCLLFVNMASAELTTWDNWKSYDEVTREVVVKDLTGEIGKARLNTPLKVDVPTGYQKVAEFDLWAYEDYNDILKSIEFYDKNQKDWEKHKFTREFDIKYKSFKDVEVDDYDTICEVDPKSSNKTEVCDYVKVGTKTEKQEVWNKVTPATLKKNEVVTVGIFTNVEYGDYVEWIPTIYGVKVEEWATFKETTLVGLEAYYKMDDASTTLVNSIQEGTNDLTSSGATASVTGILNTAYSFDGSDDYAVGTSAITGDTTISASVWLKPEDCTTGGGILAITLNKDGELSTNTGFGFGFQDCTASQKMNILIQGVAWGSSSCATVDDDNWHHYVFTRNGNTYNLYEDGSTSPCSTLTNAGGSFSDDTLIGTRSSDGGIDDFKGDIDEFGLWNRILNSTEITELYGGGSPPELNGTTDQAPTITLNSPTSNATYNTWQDVTFNFTAYDDIQLSDVKIFVNTALNQTNATGLNNTDYLFDLGLQDGEWLIYGQATDNNSAQTTTQTINITIDTTPFIEFLTPPTLVNYANITQEYIPMKVNVSTPYFENITYYLENANGTSYTKFYENETYDINFTNMPDGHYHYNVTVCTTTNKCNTTETRHLNHDVTPPTLSALNNFTDFLTKTLPINSTWNYTATDGAIDKCYYNTSDDATFNVITCNASTITTWTTSGNKSIQFCANDTFGNEACATESIWVVQYSQTDTDPIAEGGDATFTLVLNATDIATTTATFNINGTQYDTSASASADAYIFTKVLNIPDTWGNTTGVLHNWYFNVSGSITGNTATENITVYELAVDDCSVYTDVILDMNLFDEKTAIAVNESAGASVEIDLQLQSKTNPSVILTYNNTWTDENNPKVCIPSGVLNNSDYWIDFTVGFSSTDHVWEFYYLDDGTLNNSKVFDVQTTTPLYLMDLLTADSTSFLFNYFDVDGLPVEDAIVHVYRKYIGEGTFREVERAKADLNGDTIVHLVEEDVIYYFVISQYGEILFTSSQYTALCQATPCTIQIEASGGSASFPTDWDLVDGGAYSISSSATDRTVNLTFTNNETTTYNFTVYKYNSDGSYSAINTSSSTGTSGSVIMTVPQSAGNVSFFASVVKDDQFINSEWIDFTGKASDRFGVTTALFISALIILCLGLISITEGVGTLVFVILGVALSGFLGLITTELSTGVNVVVYLVIAGGIILWKLTGGRR